METCRQNAYNKERIQNMLRLGLLITTLTLTSLFAFYRSDQYVQTDIVFYIVGAILFSALLIGLDIMIARKSRTATLNTFSLSIIFGLCLGFGLHQTFQLFNSLISIPFFTSNHVLVEIFCYITGLFLSLQHTFRFADQLQLIIPFIKLNEEESKQHPIILDSSVLKDPRIVELALSGIFNKHLSLPNCVFEEIHMLLESGTMQQQMEAKKSLDNIEALGSCPEIMLELLYDELPKTQNTFSKVMQLAKKHRAYVLVSEITKDKEPFIEGGFCISLSAISAALKPLPDPGNFFMIKVQRYGNEPRQGVGYLEDGTMVVINGGAEYLGKEVHVKKISTRTTSSGHMIFCNTTDVEEENYAANYQDKSAKDYYTVRT